MSEDMNGRLRSAAEYEAALQYYSRKIIKPDLSDPEGVIRAVVAREALAAVLADARRNDAGDVAFMRVMEGPRVEPETFATRLTAMRRDLAMVVDKMNRDSSEDVAMKAQTALNAVSQLLQSRQPWFDDLPWSWDPDEAA